MSVEPSMDDDATVLEAWETRFWAQVDIRGPEHCWHWMGPMNRAGYGVFVIGGLSIGAHQFSNAVAAGEVPAPGLVVRHACDNRGCVNPRHLQPGTHAENMQDMVRRGRHRGGRRTDVSAVVTGEFTGLDATIQAALARPKPKRRATATRAALVHIAGHGFVPDTTPLVQIEALQRKGRRRLAASNRREKAKALQEEMVLKEAERQWAAARTVPPGAHSYRGRLKRERQRKSFMEGR